LEELVAIRSKKFEKFNQLKGCPCLANLFAGKSFEIYYRNGKPIDPIANFLYAISLRYRYLNHDAS
jgi:hypothetical protein